MSFDDYANHIYQKHRLAVALAILKSKPANINTENYIKELKSKIDEKMDDDDITICSDDFVMDDDDEFDDSVNILNDFDAEFNNDDNLVEDNMQIEPENLSQITYYNSQSEPSENISQPLTNVSIPQDKLYQTNTECQPKITVTKESNNETKNIDEHKAINNESYSQKDSRVVFNKETKDPNNKTNTVNDNMDTTHHDSQETVIYTVPGFTQNFTHYSQSQANIVIPSKYIHNVNKNKNVLNKDIVGENDNTAANLNAFEVENHFGCKENSVNSNKVQNVTNRGNIEFGPKFSQSNDDKFDEIQIENAHFDDKNKRFENDSDLTVNRDREGDNIPNSNRNTQNIDEYFDEIRAVNDTGAINSVFDENNMNLEVLTDIEHIVNENLNIDCLSQNIENQNTDTIFGKAIDKTKVNNEILSQNDENLHQNCEKSRQITSKPSVNNSSEDLANREEITEEEYDTQEIISYKVLEEFNKVKSFLNRQKRGMSSDGYSTDSGYKSDSQSRNSNRSALQLSGNWLNQSGCCLFNYIMECPLIASTRDITNEIAQILSQLIDKLHEDEQYPSFLEDILESVKLLLRDTYEGVSSEESEFLKKDENIQRLLLLNKSVHIQKHSIEIVTDILEKFHTKITEKDTVYELTNIDEIENLAYIFHILEILLKKYMKNQEFLSQTSTQNSQENEKILKKSSITDIWRKKWNPKQENFEGSREKKCVLKNCSEILNKIVVDCVSGYSLVAYSALKCFNTMQS